MDQDHPNGAVPARVRFDRDHPDKTLAIEDAAEILMAWRARNPAQFGYWLAAAIIGTEPAKSSRSGAAHVPGT